VRVEVGAEVLAGGAHVGDLAVAVDDQAVRFDVLLHAVGNRPVANVIKLFGP
jgi:hypothetical protein